MKIQLDTTLQLHGKTYHPVAERDKSGYKMYYYTVDRYTISVQLFPDSGEVSYIISEHPFTTPEVDDKINLREIPYITDGNIKLAQLEKRLEWAIGSLQQGEDDRDIFNFIKRPEWD